MAGLKSPKSSVKSRPVSTKGNKVQYTGAFKNPNAGIRGQKKQGR